MMHIVAKSSNVLISDCGCQMPIDDHCLCGVCPGGCRWIRIPAIIYGSHVATTLIPILFQIMTADFSSDTCHMEPATVAAAAAGPVTLSERLSLAAVYVPYLVVPLLLVLYMLTSEHYLPSKPSQRSLKQQ